jgi:hypothetical protein
MHNIIPFLHWVKRERLDIRKTKNSHAKNMGSVVVISLSSLIRTLTVGTGISPVRPSSYLSAVRGLYHRYGISPIPKDYDSIKKRRVDPTVAFLLGLPHGGSPI